MGWKDPVLVNVFRSFLMFLVSVVFMPILFVIDISKINTCINVHSPGFFPVLWEWVRVPYDWENSGILADFGKSFKKMVIFKICIDSIYIANFYNFVCRSAVDLFLLNLR